VLINGFMSTGAGNPGMQRGQIVQALDNVTWTRRKHSFKFGGDFKRISDHDDNVYGNYRSGWYVFNGSSMWARPSAIPTPLSCSAIPDYTEVSSTNKPTMDGLGYSYAAFAQDDWKITPRLTLNLGLRYELHPPIRETTRTPPFSMPDYSGTDWRSGGERRGGGAQRAGRVLRVRRSLPRHCAHAHPDRRAGRDSLGPCAIRTTPALARASALPGALWATTRPSARRLGTLHRVAARLLAGLRLGRPCQLSGHLQPGLRRTTE
jgi:hypothetical protein